MDKVDGSGICQGLLKRRLRGLSESTYQRWGMRLCDVYLISGHGTRVKLPVFESVLRSVESDPGSAGDCQNSSIGMDNMDLRSAE